MLIGLEFVISFWFLKAVLVYSKYLTILVSVSVVDLSFYSVVQSDMTPFQNPMSESKPRRFSMLQCCVPWSLNRLGLQK